MPQRFTSPVLQGLIMDECPVGYVLRESPETYEFLSIAPLISQGSASEFMAMSKYVQRLARVYSTEKDRVREMKKVRNQSKKDASAGARIRKQLG